MTHIKLSIILIILVLSTSSCSNAQEQQGKAVVAISPTKMNVLYMGVDNPVNIAVSGYNSSELIVEATNATILGENGKYIVRPRRIGNITITIYHSENKLAEANFRVKSVPNPVATIPKKANKPNEYYINGPISKEDLLNAGQVVVVMQNFDFDLRFKVVSFVVSTTEPGSLKVKSESSDSDKYTEKQINLIKSLKTDQKVMIEEIKAVGPDGIKRDLSPLVFTIN